MSEWENVDWDELAAEMANHYVMKVTKNIIDSHEQRPRMTWSQAVAKAVTAIGCRYEARHDDYLFLQLLKLQWDQDVFEESDNYSVVHARINLRKLRVRFWTTRLLFYWAHHAWAPGKGVHTELVAQYKKSTY